MGERKGTLDYNLLLSIPDYSSRLGALKTLSTPFEETFGETHRRLNQRFYSSRQWRRVRNYIIARDDGNDLAVSGMPIVGPIFVHHIVPITIKDVINHSDSLLDPNNLVCCSLNTHNAIHYGVRNVEGEYIPRRPGDIDI